MSNSKNNGERDFKDWCQDAEITNTIGKGWCVRIYGSDVFDDINQYGVKTRRTLSIASGFGSEEEAKQALREWLQRQLNQLENRNHE
jgi:hypothetical protein